MNKPKEQNNSKLKTRLSRIKGQFRGVEQMIDENKDCLEVLNQIAAIKGALTSLGRAITEEETSCLRLDKKDSKKLKDILNRLIKIN